MIRPSALLLLGVVLAAAPARSQTVQQETPTAQTFIDLEHKWNDASLRKDTVALGAILADGYVITDEQGHVRDKAATLSRVQSGSRTFQSMTLSDIHVHVYGNAAVVTGVNTVTGTTEGASIPPKLAFTDVFVRQDGAWRAVATHVSTVR